MELILNCVPLQCVLFCYNEWPKPTKQPLGPRLWASPSDAMPNPYPLTLISMFWRFIPASTWDSTSGLFQIIGAHLTYEESKSETLESSCPWEQASTNNRWGGWWINASAPLPLSGTTLGHVLQCLPSSPEGPVTCLITHFISASFPQLFPVPSSLLLFSGTIFQINHLHLNACLSVCFEEIQANTARPWAYRDRSRQSLPSRCL